MLRLDDGEILKRFDTAFSVVNDAISTLRRELDEVLR